MASKPTKGRLLEYVDGEIELEEPGQSDEEQAFSNFRESLRAGDAMATLRVSRIPKNTLTGHPTNAKSIHCFSCSIDQYDYEELLDFISENYGGGLYRLIGTMKGKQGTAFNRLVEIAEQLKPKTPSDGSPTNLGGIMESVANLINASQERTEALLARAQPMVQNPVDPFSMFKEFAALMASLGMIGQKPPQSDAIAELTRLKMLKDLMEDFSDGGSGGSDRGTGSNAYDLIGKTLDTLGPAFVSAMAQQKVAAIQAPQKMNPNMPRQPSGPVTIEQQVTQPIKEAANPMNALKGQIEALVRNAKRGVEAETMASTVIAMTPEDRLGDLAQFVGAADSVEQMARVVPEVHTYKEWFTTLRASLLAQLTPATEIDHTPVATSEDASE